MSSASLHFAAQSQASEMVLGFTFARWMQHNLGTRLDQHCERVAVIMQTCRRSDLPVKPRVAAFVASSGLRPEEQRNFGQGTVESMRRLALPSWPRRRGQADRK